MLSASSPSEITILCQSLVMVSSLFEAAQKPPIAGSLADPMLETISVPPHVVLWLGLGLGECKRPDSDFVTVGAHGDETGLLVNS